MNKTFSVTDVPNAVVAGLHTDLTRHDFEIHDDRGVVKASTYFDKTCLWARTKLILDGYIEVRGN